MIPPGFVGIERGKPHPMLAGRMLAEGPRVGISRDGIDIWMIYDRPTPREVRGGREGKIRLGLVSAGQHSLFLLLHCEPMTKGWTDMPYALGIVPEQDRMPLGREPNLGRAVHFQLVETGSHIVHALRALSITPAFSAKLEGLLRDQERHLAEFSPAAHRAEVKDAYARWPTSDAMARNAVAIECAGLPFKPE